MSEIRGQDDIDGDAVSQEDDMSRSFLAPNFTVEEIEENGEREFLLSCHSYRHINTSAPLQFNCDILCACVRACVRAGGRAGRAGGRAGGRACQFSTLEKPARFSRSLITYYSGGKNNISKNRQISDS